MPKSLLGFFSFGWFKGLDFLPPLLIRLFLGPILWVSGSNKLGLFRSEDFIWTNFLTWFDLDNPTFQATVSGIEKLSMIPQNFVPMISLSIGLLEVIGAVFLFIGFAIRWISLPLLSVMALTAFISLNGENILNVMQSLLMNDGFMNVETTSFNKSVIYFLMLLSLFFMGAGRFFSVDWFLYRSLYDRIHDTSGWANGVRVAENIRPAPLVNHETNKNRISQDTTMSLNKSE